MESKGSNLRGTGHGGCRRGSLAAATVGLICLSAASASAGRIYSYVDARGTTHFTNVPQDRRYTAVQFRRISLQSPTFRDPPAQTRRYDGLIGLTARQHRVQPALVKAVIAAESNFDPSAVSRKGAQGLMQLMPKTAAGLGVTNPLHPEENVRGGVVYLRTMLDRYGDVSRALAAYNAGPSAVDRFGGIPPYRETQDYVQRVLTYYRFYHGDFGR